MRSDVQPSAIEVDLDYLERIHPPLEVVLAELESRGRADNVPIIDRATGHLLSVLASALRPANILEIGTAYGYSTLWFACGQPESGRIVTIDPDRARTALAQEFWQRAGVAQRIEVINAPALSALPKLARTHFDMVLIDALKEEYAEYLECALPLLKVGGLVLVDNLLWHHGAAQPARKDDPETTLSIRRFNEMFLRHPQLNATILPVGDGVGVGAKIR